MKEGRLWRADHKMLLCLVKCTLFLLPSISHSVVCVLGCSVTVLPSLLLSAATVISGGLECWCIDLCLQVEESTPTCWGFLVECHGQCWWPGHASCIQMLWQPLLSTSFFWSFPSGECPPPLSAEVLYGASYLQKFNWVHLSFPSYREWPNPVLLKQPEDSNLNLPVWDPRVSKHLSTLAVANHKVPKQRILLKHGLLWLVCVQPCLSMTCFPYCGTFWTRCALGKAQARSHMCTSVTYATHGQNR